MEGAGWSWRGLHLTQRSHFSIKLVQAGQALQGLKPAATEVGENMPRCRWSRMRWGQNEELGYPGSHSQYCSRWAGQHGTSRVTGKKAQSKRNLNFVLMVTTGRKNVLAETVNFLCWMKKTQNQNPKKTTPALLFLWTLRDCIYHLHPLVCIWGKVAAAQEQLSSAMRVTK